MTLYLKYRPKILEELDIKEVRESLKKTVSSGNIPHAFLFSGPKGTGKTSAARIIAKIVNCEAPFKIRKGKEPCNKCEQCKTISVGNNLDVIELDAASNRGIDDIRSLKDAVKLAPAKAKKKVYIIDEAHMLTPEAANALLKTLEEPPEHVIFILATTNPEKLTETIRSRATSILFRKATLEEVVRSLTRVVKGEKLKIPKEAIEMIAKAGYGSFRDAVKILEQLNTEKSSFNPKEVEEALFRKKSFSADSFLELLAKKDTKACLKEIERVVQSGGLMEIFLSELLERLRSGLLYKVGVDGEDLPGFDKKELVDLVELFNAASGKLKGAFLEQIPVEIAVIQWCGQKDEKNFDPDLAEEETKPQETQTDKAEKKAEEILHNKNLKEISDDVWKKILSQVRPVNTSIEALLRAARPVGFDGRTLTLSVYYKFHKERLEDGRHRQTLEGVVSSVLGGQVRVVCHLSEPPKREMVKPAKEETALTDAEDKDIIKVAEEIFGN